MEIDIELHHPNCKISRCPVCFEDHENLSHLLNDLCSTQNKVDHLGKYHKWLGDNGINPETEWGWATPATFETVNIEAYVTWYLEVYGE